MIFMANTAFPGCYARLLGDVNQVCCIIQRIAKESKHRIRTYNECCFLYKSPLFPLFQKGGTRGNGTSLRTVVPEFTGA